MNSRLIGAAGVLWLVGVSLASDPQLKTTHPFYPGELSCSSFERLAATQAEVYQRITGRSVLMDEDKALAAWYWRNLHYAHGEEGKGDCFDAGFGKGEGNRDYWHGLFAHGFGLCGTTHAQWTAELNYLLGHCRSRVTGVTGHNSFEVYLTGGAYGAGRWALLDHDVSTVIFSADGARLLSIPEAMADLKTLKNPAYKTERQRGWRVAGLHDEDAAAYTTFASAEYLSGYAGPPPLVNLRPGEKFRRYLNPGLDDGRTFVFWGLNYKAGGIPGPERSRAWVNQPENMYKSTKGTGWKAGQVRYANAVYTYAPNFADGSYKQGVIDESDQQVIFEFYTPYVIAATPANDKPWGIYDVGGKNGLVIEGEVACPVSISTDQGRRWQQAGMLAPGKPLDATDLVKGHQQYLLRLGAGADALKGAKLSWRTVCQCNVAIIPRLHDGINTISYEASGHGIISAGPNKDQAEAHVVDGRMGGNTVTLELKTPRGEKAARLYAASWNASGNPPGATKFRIEYSVDDGKAWRPVVKDWQIIRRSPEPADFWSQSFCYGDVALDGAAGPVRVRFANDGGKTYRKVEAHLVYQVRRPSPVDVTFAWRNSPAGPVKTATRAYTATRDDAWKIDAGSTVQTLWVEMNGR